MKIFKQISLSILLFLLCLFENYLNTFISLNFGVYIFFILLTYIGTDAFNQNLVFPIFITGILYDSFFSTYYLGLYTAIFLFVVILSNFFVSKYNKSNIVYLIIFTICLLIYKIPILVEFEINYWLSSYLISIVVNLFILLTLKRVLKVNV